MDTRERYVSRSIDWVKKHIRQKNPAAEPQSEPQARRSHDNGKKVGLSANQRQKLYAPGQLQATHPDDGRGAIILSNEGEVESLSLTQQEAAVSSYVFLNTIESLYQPEDLIGSGVTASEVGIILGDQAQSLDKNFRKVVSNGSDYYLKIRSQALEKWKLQLEQERPLENIAGSDFENLTLALTSIPRDNVDQIIQFALAKDPEQIVDEEFPRGVTENAQVEEENIDQTSPESSLRDEVGGLVARFDNSRIYDIKNGIAIYVPYKVRVLVGVFDKRNFDKAVSLGIISPIGKNKLHQMDKFSRKDLIRLYWTVIHYNLRGMQKLSSSQEQELNEIGQVYDEIMESKTSERAQFTGK